VTPGQYATCSILPSTIPLNGAPQNAIVTINTITTINPAATAHNAPGTSPHVDLDKAFLCLLPAGLLFFWNTKLRRSSNATRSRSRQRSRTLLWILLLSLGTLWPSGCGSGGDPNLRITPPGTYRYQVTASSTTGVQLSQTVTLNLTVTAQ
jgi:trimeric autotransporter adhesin